MSAPVTAEELAEIERTAHLLASAEPGLAAFTVRAGGRERLADLAPRLARDLTAAQASIRGLIEALNEAQTDRDALAAKIETMLRDEEDDRALRLAEHAAREDVTGQLVELQAAVREHRSAHEAGEGETVALVRLYQLAGLA